jgi:hypothetical protein
MYDIIYNTIDGIIKISDKFDINATASFVNATPYFDNIGDEYVLSFINLHDVKKFTKFTYDTLGSIESRYLATYYRISRDTHAWTTWVELKTNITDFPLINTKDPLFIDIKWIRVGTSTIGSVRLLEYELTGSIEREVSDGESTISLTSGNSLIIKPPYIYKVFKITDIEIISKGNISGLEIKYRFSQDTGRSWSNWEPFTKENITTVRINPVRFFQIEYQIINNGSSTANIYDINLIGDFQNVTNDYFKTNLFGIRECCTSNLLGSNGGYAIDSNGNIILDANGNPVPATNTSGSISSGNCENGIGRKAQMTAEEQAKLFNPYQQTAAVNLLAQMSNDAQQVFGFKVEYFLTDPDKKGQDATLHEYQLFNIVCSNEIKISVEGNNFPDSQITMNQFDLNLFETMEVHITKENFKSVFGPHRRPSKEDFLWFCDVNRMYQVDHSQQFRGFNNTAIYYKLILKKYTQKANVQAGSQTIQDKLTQLTKNSTIDELFGIENNQDKAAVANKDQFQPLTKDPIRLEYFASIDKELIENSSTIISKSNYDLSSIVIGTTAVKYKNLDPIIKVSDNIGFSIWFNINNYVLNESYNFFNYYDETNNLGWKANLSNDNISVTLNSSTYSFNLTGVTTSNTVSLDEETWYCYVLNIDQRQRKLNQYIYKRDVNDEEDAPGLESTVLRLEYENEQSIIPIEYELENIYGEILGSDMKVTNIRLFIDVIPKETHNKILNQYIIRDDSKFMVFADNANTRLVLPYMPLGNE